MTSADFGGATRMDLLKSLSTTPSIVLLAVVLVFAVVAILLWAIHRGREISFWPPKISAPSLDASMNGQTEIPALLGEWFEEIPHSPDRRYSIGVFRFNGTTRTHSYDGANFRNDGIPFCTWRSKAVIIDLAAREVQYIFDASMCDKRHESNTGFGVINLVVEEDGTMTSDSGYYIEAKKDGKPLSHSMRRLDDVAKELGIARRRASDREYYAKVIQAFERARHV
jgi:hypothetical protein